MTVVHGTPVLDIAGIGQVRSLVTLPPPGLVPSLAVAGRYANAIVRPAIVAPHCPEWRTIPDAVIVPAAELLP